MPHLAPIPQLKFQRGITTGDSSSSSAQLIYPSLPKLATGRPASDPEGKSDPGTNAASDSQLAASPADIKTPAASTSTAEVRYTQDRIPPTVLDLSGTASHWE